MKKRFLFSFFLLTLHFSAFAQLNIHVSDPQAENIMLGQYNPSAYLPSVIIQHPDSISQGLLSRISPDSLKENIIRLSQFRNRNSGSDTLSPTFGIGAARTWVFSKFQQYSAASENRLLPFYLVFDRYICGKNSHKNICALLPGTDTTDKSIILIEAHIDSRCEGLCDTLCNAQGIEDNASGTALVMELARVMSKYTYRHTLVFMLTIAEEQGLYGAEAFADYVVDKGIQVKAVQNNDVIGGILCGQTSSPPSCPGLGDVDSLDVRLFSAGSFNSKHKGYARFTKLEYKEQILPWATVPMNIVIMSPEDRTGRGGDHIPFRQKNITAIRYTSANEHGDANVADTSYHDRQHSYRDTLGVDTGGDDIIDSFFVDFHYLARNASINANAAAMCAIGPQQPDFLLTSPSADKIIVEVTDQTQYDMYRVGVRSNTHDWDTVFTMTNTLADTFDVSSINDVVYVSIMSVDEDGVESIPSTEYTVNISSIENTAGSSSGFVLYQNRPNPFDESTYIQFYAGTVVPGMEAYLSITNMKGIELRKIPVQVQQGLNEVMYTHGYGASGVLYYSLVVGGKVIATRPMVFAN